MKKNQAITEKSIGPVPKYCERPTDVKLKIAELHIRQILKNVKKIAEVEKIKSINDKYKFRLINSYALAILHDYSPESSILRKQNESYQEEKSE